MFYYAHWDGERLTAVEARSVPFWEPDGTSVTELTQQEYEAHLAALLPEQEEAAQ